MSLESGTKLGPYEILEAIGRGGMGEVYKARDTRLDRTVAIKVLPEHLADSPERKARFEREAKTISQLNHPHICTLHDVGEQDGVHFLVMEYIEGVTLAERLKKGALPLDEALACGIQIGDGLDKAHRAGIVHRDLKPGNVMLTKSGVKLLDFGLARVVQGEDATESSDAPTRQKDLTKEQAILGTLQYMAPEQLEGKPADARTDVFAFGALLYEMMTGERAFEGKSQASLSSAIMSSEPRPISELQSLSPAVLDRIARRCLEKDPDERWQTAKDLTAELAWVREHRREGELSERGSKPDRRRERWAWGVAVVATLAALALAAARNDRAPANEGVTQFPINPPEDAALSHFYARASPVVSPDGRRVAFSAQDRAGERIWVRSLDALEARPLAGSGVAHGFFWSPDSRSIGFFGDGALKKVDVGGGRPQTLVENVGYGFGGTWNDEGVVLFSPVWSPIHRARSGGNTSGPLTRLDVSRHEVDHRWPQFLPDGEHFLFHVQSKEAEYQGTYVASLAAPEDKRLILSGAQAATYAAPGYLLFAREGNLLAQRFDLNRLEIVGEPIALNRPVAVFYGRGLFSASTNGVLAYRRPYTSDYRLAWFDRRGNQLGILPGPGGAQNPELSPDDQQVAFERWDPETGTRDVWLADLSRGVASRFTFDPSDDSDPVWSPDGRQIAFSSGRDGYQSLYRREASGSSEVETIHQAEDEEYPMSWSPDGEHIVYERFSSDRGGFLMLLPLSGSREPVPMTGSDFEELQPQFSPDGKWMSYTSNESGRNEIYVQPVPQTGARFQISTEGGTDGRWRGDGEEIFYLAPDRTLMAVPLRSSEDRLRPSTPQALFTAPTSGLPLGAGLRFLYDVSRDGERFLMSQVSPSSSPEMAVVLNWTEELER